MFARGDMIQRDRLADATQEAIEAARQIDRTKWPPWADNVAIFTLARYLAAVDPTIDADDLQPYVLGFWNATKDPKDWEEAWEQFLDIWDHRKARVPAGNLANVAADRAQHTQDQQWAHHYRPAMRYLVRICIELARMRQDRCVFSLSQIDAGRILNCDRRTAGRMLHRLCRDGILIVRDRPPKGCLKAIRYRLMRDYPNYQSAHEDS